MSWSIKIVGKPADVKAAINANEYLPKGLKDCVADYADEAEKANVVNASNPQNQQVALMVCTSGHHGSGGWANVSEFTIAPIVLVSPTG